MSEERVKVASLRPGMDHVTVRVRVIEAGSPHEIETRNGRRTISEAVVGDETGRVRLTLWGRKAGSLTAGEVVEISNAWTTSYRGQVILNAGARSEIRRLSDEDAPGIDEVPEKYPQAPRRRTGFSGTRGRGFRSRRTM